MKTGKLPIQGVYAELGHIVVGDISGRVGDETIVCDLTGAGAQDAAIGEAVWKLLSKRK